MGEILQFKKKEKPTKKLVVDPDTELLKLIYEVVGNEKKRDEEAYKKFREAGEELKRRITDGENSQADWQAKTKFDKVSKELLKKK